MAHLPPPLGTPIFAAQKELVPDQTLLPEPPGSTGLKVLLLLMTVLWVVALLGLLIQFVASQYGFMPKVDRAFGGEDPTLRSKFEHRVFSIMAADGQIIDVSWYISKKPKARKELPTIVYFHGRNDHNMDIESGAPSVLSHVYPYLGGADDLPNFNAIEINYRGTTPTSKTTWPTSQEVVLDGDAVIQFLRSKKVPLANLRLLGFSMGGGVATEVKRLYPEIPQLCIINSFRNLDRVVAEQLPWLPIYAFQYVYGASEHGAWKYFFGAICGAIAFLLGACISLILAIFLGLNWLLKKTVGLDFLGWNFDSSKTLKRLRPADYLVLDHERDATLKDARLGKSSTLCKKGRVCCFAAREPEADFRTNIKTSHTFDFGAAQVSNRGRGADVIGRFFGLTMPGEAPADIRAFDFRAPVAAAAPAADLPVTLEDMLRSGPPPSPKPQNRRKGNAAKIAALMG